MEWKNYLDDRLIAEHTSGFFVIKQEQSEDISTPVFCPTCDSIMSSIYDGDAYEKLGCCDSCSGKFAYPNIEKWRSGWRPSREDVDKLRKDHT